MLLASCATDIKLHECSNYELVHTCKSTNFSDIQNISWCKDGSWLALIPSQGHAEILRIKQDVRLLHSILGVPNLTCAIFQRTAKKNMTIGTTNGGILVYDIKARSIKKRFASLESCVGVLDWNCKDSHLAAVGGCSVTLYSNTTNQKTNVITIPEYKSLSVVRFHCTEKELLATSSGEGTTIIWDVLAGKRSFGIKSHQGEVSDVVFSSQNRNLLVSVGLDRSIQCCDTSSYTIALRMLTDHPLSAVDMASDGYTIAAASSKGTIYIYDLRHYLHPLKTLLAHLSGVKRVLYRPSTPDLAESSNITEDSVETHEVFQEHPEMIEFPPEIGDYFPTERPRSFDLQKKAPGDFYSNLSNLGITDGVKRWLDSKNPTENKLDDSFTQSSQDGSQCQIHIMLKDSRSQVNKRLEYSKSQAVRRTEDFWRQVNEKLEDSRGKINKKLEESKKHIYFDSCSHTSKKRPSSSTPVHNLSPASFLLSSQELSDVSPMGRQPVLQQCNAEELGKMVKTAVTEALAEEMTELTDYLSRQFLNLQMFFGKQFVYQEEHIEKLRNEIQCTCDVPSLILQVQQLRDENEFLKSKLAEFGSKNT